MSNKKQKKKNIRKENSTIFLPQVNNKKEKIV